MREKKQSVEQIFYIFSSILTVAGVVLLLAGLFVPRWYRANYTLGQMEVRVNMGLWMDEVCVGDRACEYKWLHEDYDRSSMDVFPSSVLIQGFETAATGLGLFALLSHVLIWIFHYMHSTACYRNMAYVMYFTSSIAAAFLSVVGTLILSSKGDDNLADFAPFFSGVGGAVFFIAGCMACVICRYDPSYGTLDNPVSPKFVSA